MKLPNPVTTFFGAALARKALNLRGLPLIPKALWASAPSYRTGFNQFVMWIDRLQLTGVHQVVDVGACHGDFSQAATSMFPNAQVLLVEPSVLMQTELARRSAEHNGRWRLAKCALGRKRGAGSLYIDPKHADIASLVGFSDEYLRANSAANPQECLECEVRTLDDLCEEHAITVIDLLKIDVEGFEFEVLEGGVNILSNTRAIVVELSLIRQSGSEDALERMLKYLRLAGFHFVDLIASYFDPDKDWRPVEFNLLARRID